MSFRYVGTLNFSGVSLSRQRQSQFVMIPLALYLISVPLISAHPVGANVSQGLGMIAGIAFASNAILRRRIVRIPPELIAFGIFVGYSFIGGFVAVNMATFVARQFTLVQLWFLVVMIFDVFYVHQFGTERMFRILLLGIIGAAVIGLLSWEPGTGRLGGTLVNPNGFGAAMLLGLGLILLLPVRPGLLHPALVAILSAGLTVAVTLSGSRKAMLGSLALLCVYGMLTVFRNARHPLRLIGLVVIVLLGSLAVFRWFETTPYWSRIENLFQFMQGESVREGSVYERAAMMVAGIEVWKENPVIGVGTDQFRYHAGAFGIRETYSHSNPIEVLANFGLVGALLYYGAYGALSWRLASVIRRCWSFRELRYRLLFLTAFWIIWVVLEVAWVTYYSKIHWIAFAMVLTTSAHLERRMSSSVRCH